MSTPQPTRVLTGSATVDQHNRMARELLEGWRRRDSGDRARFVAFHPQGERIRELRLGDAQLVIAREYGFASWPGLRTVIEGIGSPSRTELFVADPAWHEGRAAGLVEMHRGALSNALAQIRTWHPRMGAMSLDAIAAAQFTLDDARLTYARQHGLPHWAALMARLPSVEGSGNGTFAQAFAALSAHDLATVAAMVEARPELLQQRGSNGNTLLNLAVSVERDATPIVQMLLAAGADPNVPNDRGWTPLHQARTVALVDLLLDAGAVVSISAHGDGGTPLAVALWSRRTAVTRRLAEVAILPDNLRVSAALDRTAGLDRFFADDGSLTADAGAYRGFYRPHSGFPAWSVSEDPQDVLDEALAWAARTGALPAAQALVARGADVNSVVYRGTPLMFAAHCRQVETVRWLLAAGADVNQLALFHGGEAGRVAALHLAAQTNDAALVTLLLDAGADRTMRDENYQADAAGWAAYANATTTLPLLQD
ncbi:MAG TPA: ankyrin repeat domain-containing protein [Gemmatimonadales bacterium]